jgi:hypothetical protein
MQALLARHRARLAHRDEAVPRELAPRASDAYRARDPQHGLQIAQAAGALLDVRLEVVRGVVVLEMALLLLEHLAGVEGAHVHGSVERAREARVEAPRAAEQAPLEQARAHGDVGVHLGDALADRAHRVAELEADVPQRRDEALDLAVAHAVALVGQEHQHVDVGMREELAASIPAHGEQRDLGRDAAVAPRCGDDAIGQARVRAQERGRIGPREEGVADRRALAPPFVAPRGDARCRRCLGHYRGRRGHGGVRREEEAAFPPTASGSRSRRA